MPLLARLGFDKLVRRADYPGSQMVPADAALLSLLTLKLLDKERRSHIDDFNFEPALGLFAGLNILPKKSFATDYSYRAGPDQQRRLLTGWVKRLAPLLLPEAGEQQVERGDVLGDDCRGGAPALAPFHGKQIDSDEDGFAVDDDVDATPVMIL